MIAHFDLPRQHRIDIKYSDKVYNPKKSDIGTIVMGDMVLRFLEGDVTVVDVACGSGKIGLSLKQLNPDIKLIMTDIDPNAVAEAKANAERLKLDAEVVVTNLLTGIKDYNVVVANLPTYTKADMAKYPIEGPELAYFADDEDGLKLYRRLFEQADLKQDGWMIVECQAGLQLDLLALAQEHNYGEVMRNEFGFAFVKRPQLTTEP
jgi:methylase of polypeptide subunit release factors